jgi:hypothetical protein
VLESRLWLLLAGAALAWTLWRGDCASWFFLLQAAVPWLLSVAISCWSGRPVFLERYLAFAQLALFGYFGMIVSRLPGVPERLCLACLLGALGLTGLWNAVATFPATPPAHAAAAAYLKDHFRTGEVVLTDGPATLNRLRYYADRAGIHSLVSRCELSPFLGSGHICHLASLEGQDVVWEVPQPGTAGARRVWLAFDGTDSPLVAPSAGKQVVSRTFEGGGATRYTLVLYDRAE